MNEAIKRQADRLLPRLNEAEGRWAYTEPPAGFQFKPFNGTASDLLAHVLRLINQNIVDRGAADREHRVEFTTQEQYKSPGFSENQVLQLLEQGYAVRASIIFDQDTKAGFCFMEGWDAMQRRMSGNQASLKRYLDKNEIRGNYEL